MTFGVDYSMYPHPTIVALENSGAKFIGRYVSPQADNDTNGKNLLPAECKAILGGGFSIILYAEQYAKRMVEGYDAGAEDATHFDAVVKALGMPGMVMYSAADWDTTPADQTGINGYLDGAASKIGRPRCGIYGGYWPVSRALNAGKATYACQTYGWSTYRAVDFPNGLPPHATTWQVGEGLYLCDARVNIRQSTYVSIGGVMCDRLNSMTTDFGQWPRPGVSVAGFPGVWLRLIGTAEDLPYILMVGITTDLTVWGVRQEGADWGIPFKLGPPIPGTWSGTWPFGVQYLDNDLLFIGIWTDGSLYAVRLNMTTKTFGTPYKCGGKVAFA